MMKRALLSLVGWGMVACSSGVILDVDGGRDTAGGDRDERAESDRQESNGPGEIALNEISCAGGDFIEIVNRSALTPRDLAGYVVTDGVADPAHRYTFPAGTLIQPGGWVVVFERSTTQAGLDFGLACAQDRIALLDPAGTEIDAVVLPLVSKGQTWGRLPDASGVWAANTPTPGSRNEPAPDLSAILYDLGQLTNIELSLSQASRDALSVDYEHSQVYVDGGFTLRNPKFSVENLNVGLRLKGSYGSFQNLDGKAAFKVKFNFRDRAQRLLGLKKMTLNNMVQDPSMIHEVMAYTIFRAFGVPAPRTGYAWVRVNGVDYGLYLVVETIDDVFLSRFYGKTTHLYEGKYGNDVSLDSVGNFEVDEGDETDRSDLVRFAKVARETADSGWVAAMAKASDFPELLRMWAVEQFIGHWDGYSPTINNYFLHSDGETRFSMLPWGTDQTFEEPLSYYSGAGYLFARCIGIAECLDAYKRMLGELGKLVGSLGLAEKAGQVANFIAPHAKADPRADPNRFDPRGQGTKDFLNQRIEHLRALLGCALAIPKPDPDGDGFSCENDCNESDPNIHKGAPDICGDGIDQDCSGTPDDSPTCRDCVAVARGPHRYLVCPTRRTYADAEANCGREGSHLAKIDSPTEEAHIWNLLGLYSLWDSWIGLSDRDTEGVFRWWDGSPPTYLNFGDGEPNDAEGNEDCVKAYSQGPWSDQPCDSLLPVVCEDACAPGEDGDKDSYLRCNDDCDDGDATVHPGASEICGDGKDNDCDGITDNGCP